MPDELSPFCSIYANSRSRCGYERMIVGFTTTCAISSYHYLLVSSNPTHSDVFSKQIYMIKFVIFN